MVMPKGHAHGCFLEDTFRTFFDVGKESEALLSFGGEDDAFRVILAP